MDSGWWIVDRKRVWGPVLLLFNLIGAVVYVIEAAHGWATPGVTVAGEPFIWAIAVAPICAIFLLLNLAWAAFVVLGRRWRSGTLLLATIPIWLVALAIDFAHH